MPFDHTEDYLRHVFGFMTGAAVSALICVGDRLGLYRALAGAGPLTAAELARHTGLSERFVEEWLRAQAAAEILEYRSEGRFELSDIGSAVLADEQDSLVFSAGGFGSMAQHFARLDELEDSFRSGIGHPFDAAGAQGAHGVERMFAPWFRHMLVPVVLAGLDGVVARLEAGANVADVGCGAGVALVTMARAFPSSTFHGYDISRHALARAVTNVREAAVTNVTLHDVSASSLPSDATFDLITAFDCLHDMTDPRSVLRAVRAAIAPGGTFLVADIKSYATYEENTERNPMAALMYSTSVLSCLQSATSEPGGAGLGTLGLHAELLSQMVHDAGFRAVDVRDFGHPVNRYYEIRP